MSNVLTFNKKEDELHASGQARCIDCKYEWIAVLATPYSGSLECPECKSCRGGLKYPMAPNENVYAWRCNCDCDHFWVVANGVLCVGCGAVTTFETLLEAGL